MPLQILEKTVAEMKLAPHEHTQTVEFFQPQFSNKVVDDRVTTQIQSPTVQVEMRQSSGEVSDSTQRQKWWIPVVQQRTDNRGQMPQMQFQRVQKKSEILSFRPPELGTSSVFRTRSERSSFPPRSRRQWRCKRKPNTANVRRYCRSEGDQQSNKIATVYEQHSSVQDPGAQASIEAEAHKRSTSVSPTMSELRTSRRPRKPKKRKTSTNQKPSW